MGLSISLTMLVISGYFLIAVLLALVLRKERVRDLYVELWSIGDFLRRKTTNVLILHCLFWLPILVLTIVLLLIFTILPVLKWVWVFIKSPYSFMYWLIDSEWR